MTCFIFWPLQYGGPDYPTIADATHTSLEVIRHVSALSNQMRQTEALGQEERVNRTQCLLQVCRRMEFIGSIKG
jgi:hypothetical protein